MQFNIFFSNSVRYLVENGVSDAKSSLILLFESYFSRSYSELFINNATLDEKDVANLQIEIDKIKNHYPVQYVIGYSYFYGYTFLVDESCLIPRFDSEILVEKCIEYLKNSGKLHQNEIVISDLCCGSGCLGISFVLELQKIYSGKITLNMIDISENALQISQKNAEILLPKLESVNYLQQDMLQNEQFDIELCDVMLFNPPYIPHSQSELLPNRVRNFEPHLALFAEKNGLIFYHKFKEIQSKLLKNNAIATIEFGDDQDSDISDIFNCQKPLFFKDLSGKFRGCILKCSD